MILIDGYKNTIKCNNTIKNTIDLDFISWVRSQKNLTFIHIPKTAGLFLSGHVSPGINLPQIKPVGHKVASVVEGYPKFSIVRNPYDWLVSMYTSQWCKKTCRNFIPTNFRNFVEILFEKKMTSSTRRGTPYMWPHKLIDGFADTPYHQILDESNEIQVDFVIKYEFLSQALFMLFDTDKKYTHELRVNASNRSFSNNPIPMITTNSAYRRDYKEFYNDELVSLVKERYKSSLDMFGYDFLEGSTDQCPMIKTRNFEPEEIM